MYFFYTLRDKNSLQCDDFVINTAYLIYDWLIENANCDDNDDNDYDNDNVMKNLFELFAFLVFNLVLMIHSIIPLLQHLPTIFHSIITEWMSDWFCQMYNIY